MKIALVRPNYQRAMPAMPIGLGYLSSVLKLAGHEVLLLDGALHRLDNRTISEMCRGADFVGVTSMTHFAEESAGLCRDLKKAGFSVLLGGIHATIAPEEMLRESGADFLIRGEAEETLPSLISSLSRGESPPERIIESPRITDLDSLPFPDWEQLPPRSYSMYCNTGGRTDLLSAMLISSRGCCCSSKICPTYPLWKEQVFYRSPENIASEIDYLRKKFGVRSIYFADENISVNPAYFREVIRLIEEQKEIVWSIGDHVRPESLDSETAEALHRSGCFRVVVGAYTEDPTSTDPLLRKIDFEAYKRALDTTVKAGIGSETALTLKMGADQEASIRKTLDFIRSLIPGSRVHLTLIPAFEAGEKEFESFVQEIKKEIPEGITVDYDVLYSSGEALPEYEKNKGISLPPWGYNYLVEGRLSFKNPVRLRPVGGKPLPGRGLYSVDGLEMRVTLGENEVKFPPEVDEKGRFRHLIPVTEELLPIPASASVHLRLPRHREIELSEIPVENLKVALPDLVLAPE